MRIIEKLIKNNLQESLTKDARIYLKERAEEYVIRKANEKYEQLIMQGPKYVEGDKKQSPKVLSIVLDEDNQGQRRFATVIAMD
jgi:hypothetical protein